MATAYEAITLRAAYPAAAAISKYYAAMLNTAGKLAKADGTGQFAGIIEYGASAADQMATVVKGAYPVLTTEDVDAGDKLTIATGADAGKFKIADTNGDVVYGTALMDAAAGDLCTIALNEVPLSITI